MTKTKPHKDSKGTISVYESKIIYLSILKALDKITQDANKAIQSTRTLLINLMCYSEDKNIKDLSKKILEKIDGSEL